MLDALPKKMLKNECAIVNLDKSTGRGTHWVAFRSEKNKIDFFDSFGLPPPKNLIDYWGKKMRVFFSCERVQKLDAFNCGHLCLKFLRGKL